MSEEFPSVPFLVTTCCSIVEEKGLDIVGVYRVPGNSAAVSNLSEQANAAARDCVPLRLDDPRWGDVNVVSSLLKSFFRKLPEPLFTAELYCTFIEASKVNLGSRGQCRRTQPSADDCSRSRTRTCASIRCGSWCTHCLIRTLRRCATSVPTCAE